METGLRLLLMLIGVIIVAGIIWDTRRHSRRKATQNDNRTEKSSLLSIQNNNFRTANEDYMIIEEDETEEFSEIGLEGLNGLDRLDEWEEPIETYDFNLSKIEPNLRAETLDEIEEKLPQDVPQIIVLHVMARNPNLFDGKQLLEAFKEAHLYFGEMQIFHRYDNSHAIGEPLFSLASAIEPGYFDPAKIDSFKTPGITLFMDLTHPKQSTASFELMLRVARQLAMRLDGELKNENRQLLSAKDIELYRENARLHSDFMPAARVS